MRDLHRSVARMFGVGFNGPATPTTFAPLLDRGVGTVILFSRNVESALQVHELCAELKRRSPGVLVCMDQEGGRVKRLRGEFTDVPSARALGRANDPKLGYEIGKILARELRAVNADWDLAPVLDVDTNPKNPVIADRSLGSDPTRVATLGAEIVRGLQDNGVAACGKHFPGHGDTWQDSHKVLPSLDHGMDRLNRVELPPFKAAIDAGVATIMTSHILFKQIDPTLPATMSEPILQGILRKQLGFNGLIVSDDLEMKAIADNYGIDQVIIRGANAGIDLFFICHDPELQNRAIDILIQAVERNEVPRERIEQANRRIDEVVKKFYRPPVQKEMLETVGCAEHRATAERISEIAGISTDPTETHLTPSPFGRGQG
jgi:beta-N-acetylhexosaminidase